MGSNHVRLTAVIALVGLAACAGTPGPGDSGYPFNVDGAYSGALSVAGQAFTGQMSVRTGDGGAVTGTFEVTSPVTIEGEVEGTLVDDQLTLDIAYGNNPATGCSAGTLRGTVTVAEGGDSMNGQLTVDDCGQTLVADAEFNR